MNLYLPKFEIKNACIVADIQAMQGQRIRRNQPILFFNKDGQNVSLPSPCDAWLRFIAVNKDQAVEPGDLLVILDAIDIADYRLDEQEVNLHTELGKAGRRGLERAGQRTFAKGYSGELFNAPAQQGQAQSPIKNHPLLKNMKEGVPPKMSDAHHNQAATERLAEDASHDPELRNQLSMDLQIQLNITPGPSNAPSLTRG